MTRDRLALVFTVAALARTGFFDSEPVVRGKVVEFLKRNQIADGLSNREAFEPALEEDRLADKAARQLRITAVCCRAAKAPENAEACEQLALWFEGKA